MDLWQNLQNKYARLNTLEKLIAVMIMFFVFPLFLRVIFFLFNSSFSGLLSFFELSANINTVLTRPWTLITYGFFSWLYWTYFLEYAFALCCRRLDA